MKCENKPSEKLQLFNDSMKFKLEIQRTKTPSILKDQRAIRIVYSCYAHD